MEFIVDLLLFSMANDLIVAFQQPIKSIEIYTDDVGGRLLKYFMYLWTYIIA